MRIDKALGNFPKSGGSEQKPMKNFGKSSRGRSQELRKFSGYHIYRAHGAVIFAIAQLSCQLKSSLSKLRKRAKNIFTISSRFAHHPIGELFSVAVHSRYRCREEWRILASDPEVLAGGGSR